MYIYIEIFVQTQKRVLRTRVYSVEFNVSLHIYSIDYTYNSGRFGLKISKSICNTKAKMWYWQWGAEEVGQSEDPQGGVGRIEMKHTAHRPPRKRRVSKIRACNTACLYIRT